VFYRLAHISIHKRRSSGALQVEFMTGRSSVAELRSEQPRVKITATSRWYKKRSKIQPSAGFSIGHENDGEIMIPQTVRARPGAGGHQCSECGLS